MMRTRMLSCGIAAATGLAGLTGVAAAGIATTELQIDLNALMVRSYRADNSMGFDGLNHTGRLEISDTSASVLAGVLINSSVVPLTPGVTLDSVSTTINLDSGMVIGGNMSILLSDGSSYTADIGDAMGQIAHQAGQGYSVDGLTFNGLFGDDGSPGNVDMFGGVDIGLWADAEPLLGSFLHFSFSPNSRGIDTQADLDVYVSVEGGDTPIIPLPGAASLGLAGMGLISLRRRR